MIHRKARSTVLALAAMFAAAAAFAALTGGMKAQAIELPDVQDAEEVEADRDEEEREDLIQVGTFDLQAVFQEHPAQEELMQAFQESQGDMQEAQQAGDHERLQALQQQFEQKRNEVIDGFKRDVDEALPGVAEEAEVLIVAQEVNYTADNVRTTDITRELLEELIGEEAAEPQPFPMPEEVPQQ